MQRKGFHSTSAASCLLTPSGSRWLRKWQAPQPLLYNAIEYRILSTVLDYNLLHQLYHTILYYLRLLVVAPHPPNGAPERYYDNNKYYDNHNNTDNNNTATTTTNNNNNNNDHNHKHNNNRSARAVGGRRATPRIRSSTAPRAVGPQIYRYIISIIIIIIC